jgi:hypothetical protein
MPKLTKKEYERLHSDYFRQVRGFLRKLATKYERLVSEQDVEDSAS